MFYSLEPITADVAVISDRLPDCMPWQPPAIPRKWMNRKGNRPTCWDLLREEWNAFGFTLAANGTLEHQGD